MISPPAAPDKQTVAATYLGCAAATGYAALKVAWALGSTVGISADSGACVPALCATSHDTRRTHDARAL